MAVFIATMALLISVPKGVSPRATKACTSAARAAFRAARSEASLPSLLMRQR